MSPLRIIPVPCLKDNYCYLLICEQTQSLVIIDPSTFEPVQHAVQETGLTPTAIWQTHHHWDHVGGILALLEAYPHMPVYGHLSDQDRIPGQTHTLEDQDRLSVGNQEATILFAPGHTMGAIAYYFKEQEALFPGDTLFSAGCGRRFEGSARQFHHSLNHILKPLPEDTQVYFGHEYTLKNLEFASQVEPQNPWIPEYLANAKETRANGKYTTPTTIGLEKKVNPFLRCDSEEIWETLKKAGRWSTQEPHQVFKQLRIWKDEF